jgi:hypothetical protein
MGKLRFRIRMMVYVFCCTMRDSSVCEWNFLGVFMEDGKVLEAPEP